MYMDFTMKYFFQLQPLTILFLSELKSFMHYNTLSPNSSTRPFLQKENKENKIKTGLIA